MISAPGLAALLITVLPLTLMSQGPWITTGAPPAELRLAADDGHVPDDQKVPELIACCSICCSCVRVSAELPFGSEVTDGGWT